MADNAELPPDKVTSSKKNVDIIERMLERDSQLDSNIDWYETKTFAAFLKALDSTRQVINFDKKPNENNALRVNQTDSRKSEPAAKSISSNCTPEHQIASPSANRMKASKSQGMETILSAEALKILSELPDLSHMSATRSFIFPDKHKARN